MPLMHAPIKDHRFFPIALVPYPEAAIIETRIQDRSIL
jgi:hypothetical protein